jgi:hypothetical protein
MVVLCGFWRSFVAQKASGKVCEVVDLVKFLID